MPMAAVAISALIQPDAAPTALAELAWHSSPVQLWTSSPVHSAPPLSGRGLLHARTCLQSPLQRLQSDQPPALGASLPQLPPVQSRVDSPVQSAPPCAGAGLVQLRDCWHDSLQGPQLDQPPGTGV